MTAHKVIALPRPAPRPIGRILVERGALAAPALDAALATQAAQRARLGEVLVSEGLVSAAARDAAIAEQHGIGRVDLAAQPPDLALVRAAGLEACREARALPWRRIGDLMVITLDDPARRAEAAALTDADRVAFALASRAELDAALLAAFGPEIAAEARTRCPAQHSCRSWAGGATGLALSLAVLGCALAAAAAPAAALAVALTWMLVVTGASGLLRFAAAVAALRRARARPGAAAAEDLAGHRPLPRISMLVPLLREERVLPQLIDALGALDYPRALLDVRLVLEADDATTRAALDRVALPPWMGVVSVPPDSLRTKPRALNVALPFTEGEIIGIWDAEDRPDPGQLRAVARAFAARPREVACLQGRLGFDNARDNLISRWFAIEYATWFGVILPGLQALGIPLPLGGTTLFVRRAALEEVGAWDAHNVTEDADLGLRLARHGYRTEMVDTDTLEEATCQPHRWIRQRSRWLKGYAITWATHMRRPGRLWRQLGPQGFIGLQVLFLGTFTAFLGAPVFWLMWSAGLGLGLADWSAVPGWLWRAAVAGLTVGWAGQLAGTLVALWRPRLRWLIPWVPTLPLYMPLGAAAAGRALWQLCTRPFHWDKTQHGLARHRRR